MSIEPGARFPAWYAVIVGLLMIGQWVFFLLAGQVPELQTKPYEIAFHLAGEAVTATVLIVAGVGLLKSLPWARSLALVGYGLLVYTTIVSPGYFAQSEEWALVAMFAVLLLLAVAAIVRLLGAE